MMSTVLLIRRHTGRSCATRRGHRLIVPLSCRSDKGLSVCIEAKSNENRLEEFLIVLNGAVEIADIVY